MSFSEACVIVAAIAGVLGIVLSVQQCHTTARADALKCYSINSVRPASDVQLLCGKLGDGAPK